MRAHLTRTSYGEVETLGILKVYDDEDNEIMELKTLELPWKDNKVRESCIPEGSYWVRTRSAAESGKFDYEHFLIEDVHERSYILFHAGNYYTDIAGCILVGYYFKDINSDRTKDVVKSRAALNDLLKKIKAFTRDGRFRLCIQSSDS